MPRYTHFVRACASVVLTATVENDNETMNPDEVARAIEMMDFKIRVTSKDGIALSNQGLTEVWGDLSRQNSGPHYVACVDETEDNEQ